MKDPRFSTYETTNSVQEVLQMDIYFIQQKINNIVTVPTKEIPWLQSR